MVFFGPQGETTRAAQGASRSMTGVDGMGQIKIKPFVRSIWRQVNDTTWLNVQGYMLTPIEGGWRLSDPDGKPLAEQLDLFPNGAPLTSWADKLLEKTPAQRKKEIA